MSYRHLSMDERKVIWQMKLLGKSQAEIEDVIDSFQRLGVQKVAPCHCSGELATRLLKEAYDEDFIQNGVGRIIETGDD